MTAQSPDFDRQLDQFIQQQMTDLAVVPGLSVAVVRDDRIIYQRGFGLRDVEQNLPVTPQTGFYIASSTKTLTGLTAARMEAAGLLDLNAPLSDFYPVGTFDPAIEAEKISLIDLLSHDHTLHNSGLQYQLAYIDELAPEDFLRILSDFSEPREKGFRYSNLSYNIVADILERVSGRHWKELVAAYVTGPLGMQHTTAYMSRAALRPLAYPYYWTQEGAFHRLPVKADGQMQSAGGYVSTAPDLTRLLLLNMNEGRLAGEQVVAPEVIRRTQHAWSSQERTFLDLQRFGYGLGWQHALYEGDTLLHHFGGFTGYQAHMSFMPEHGIGVVALSNEALTGSVLPHLVAMYAYDLLLAKPERTEKFVALNEKVRTGVGEANERWARRLAEKAEQVQQAATNPAGWDYQPAALVGTYFNPRIGAIEVTLTDEDRLLASWGPNSALLLPQAQDLFLADWAQLQPPIPLRVQYDESGRVRALDYDGREFRRLPATTRPADLLAVYTELREELARLARTPADRVAVATPELLDRWYPSGAITEPYLNTLGYRYLRAEAYPLAVAILRYATHRYPRSANAYDSLGEAYLAAGDREKAIANYRKSLEIDPDNDRARRALGELERD